MKPLTAALIVLVAVGWFGSPMAAQDGARPISQPAFAGPTLPAVIDTFCAGCHNGRMRSPSGVVLDQFDASHVAARPDVWARAYRQLQARAMPPIGAPRPDRATYEAALLAIEHSLGVLGAGTPGASTASSDAIATRLATLLWNSAPDDTLVQEARRGRLNDAWALERQVQRMLADDRARAFVSRFFVPWLQLDELAKADPDPTYFPGYDASLRDALVTETELFLLGQLRDDRDPLELWSADYTFLNGQLATHYGVPNVTGAQFRRVSSAPERAGLLGHGSILMLTSRHQRGVDAAYTSPATRAKWVRLHFLGAPLPNGFPGAQPVKPELPITPQTRTLAANPCVNCHRDFFPIGYALENFDPLGRWRTHDQAGPVDVSGEFVDGMPTNGVVELRKALLQYPEAFRTTVAEKLLVYASTGSVGPASGTPDTLIRARRMLRGMPVPRWSGLIAAVVRE